MVTHQRFISSSPLIECELWLNILQVSIELRWYVVNVALLVCVIVLRRQVTHPSRCFTHFMQFFGHQMLILWKFALLGKRILFFSPPPIGDVCYRGECQYLCPPPCVRLKLFLVLVASQWNSLPISIQSSLSRATFRSRLKTYLFNIAFNEQP